MWLLKLASSLCESTSAMTHSGEPGSHDAHERIKASSLGSSLFLIFFFCFVSSSSRLFSLFSAFTQLFFLTIAFHPLVSLLVLSVLNRSAQMFPYLMLFQVEAVLVFGGRSYSIFRDKTDWLALQTSFTRICHDMAQNVQNSVTGVVALSLQCFIVLRWGVFRWDSGVGLQSCILSRMCKIRNLTCFLIFSQKCDIKNLFLNAHFLLSFKMFCLKLILSVSGRFNALKPQKIYITYA